jgi:hypothetical protein
MDNFATQFAVVGAGLGFLPADIASVQDDNTCLGDIASGKIELDAYVDAVRQYIKTVTEGDIGDPAAAFPASPSITPAELVAVGIYERWNKLRDRILAAPTFTPEIGELLGIMPFGSGGPTPEGDIKPTLKVTAKLGNVIEVKFTRGNFDGMELEMKIDNAVDWSDAGRFFKSPAVKTIPSNGGLPRSVQVRGHYLEDDEPVGSNSDTVTVVTTP